MPKLNAKKLLGPGVRRIMTREEF